MKQKNSHAENLTKADLQDMLNTLRDEIKEEFRDYRDQTNTRFDDVMGQLETMRQENTIGVYQTNNLQEAVDGHESRIKKLEKSLHTT